MEKFELVSAYKPSGDQPEAIKELVEGIKEGKKAQVLLGATGTGKTFTISNVIAQVNKPTLVFVHNKTLASQLYSEFKEFFPNNHVEYFVSNFDFYQPEAYVPKTDTYIDKNTKTNEELDMLRMAAVNSVLHHRDTIIVASVASIYGASNPEQYKNMIETIRVGDVIDRNELMLKLVHQQYKRNDIDPVRGTFRVRGDTIEITPGHTEAYLIRIEMFGDEIERICEVDPLTGKLNAAYQIYNIYPANGYATSMDIMKRAAKTLKRNWRSVSIILTRWENRWRKNVWSSGVGMILRRCVNLVSVLGSRTIRVILMEESLERGRIRYSTIFRMISCLSWMKVMFLYRRCGECSMEIGRASKRWSIMASVCLRLWTIVR